jgi:hypothetical protein
MLTGCAGCRQCRACRAPPPSGTLCPSASADHNHVQRASAVCIDSVFFRTCEQHPASPNALLLAHLEAVQREGVCIQSVNAGAARRWRQLCCDCVQRVPGIAEATPSRQSDIKFAWDARRCSAKATAAHINRRCWKHVVRTRCWPSGVCH